MRYLFETCQQCYGFGMELTVLQRKTIGIQLALGHQVTLYKVGGNKKCPICFGTGWELTPNGKLLSPNGETYQKGE